MTSPVPKRTASTCVAIETASIRWEPNGEPFSELFGDLYFSANGGLSESRYVFIEQNHLPQRFDNIAADESFTLAETGFGTGLNFLATVELWQRSCAKGWLDFISFERYPLAIEDLQRALARWPELCDQARKLVSQYPPAIHGVHRLVWPKDRVRLTLYFGDALVGLVALPFTAQAWYLDGFNPRFNSELWNDTLYQAIAEHSATVTTFATYSAAGAVRRGLAAAGFHVEKVPGHKPKRDMIKGHFNPAGQVKEAAATGPRKSRRVVIVGAGLAGCLIAANLAQRGRDVTLVEAGPEPGSEASGNGQGALYVKLGVDHNGQSRLALAGLLYAQRYYAALQRRCMESAEGAVRTEKFWYPTGLLHLATTEQEVERQARFIDKNVYPETILRPVTPIEASHLAELEVTSPGLYFPASGWLSPKALCRALCSYPGISLMPHTRMERFSEIEDGYQVEVAPVASPADSSSQTQQLACDQLILCPGASGLLANLGIPARPIRGQISWWPSETFPSPECVICGDGYINPSDGHRVTLGATFDLRDRDPSVRTEGHQRNKDSIARWLPAVSHLPEGIVSQASGRTSFRCTTPDYQPLAGLLHFQDALPSMPRQLVDKWAGARGVAVLSGLGSKGLSYAPLLAEWVCDQICGDVPALPLDLAELVHPQRFAVRQKIREARR